MGFICGQSSGELVWSRLLKELDKGDEARSQIALAFAPDLTNQSVRGVPSVLTPPAPSAASAVARFRALRYGVARRLGRV